MFKDNAEYTAEQVRIWNEQASSDDTIYVIGDFCNYNSTEKDYISGLAVSKQINAHIILITGNSEDRVIRDIFGGDYEKFREYCLTDPHFKFEDVIRNTYVTINGEKFFLTHKPTDHDKECQTLFGHTHRYGGLWKPFGFNVGVDLNHYRLFGDDDIMFMLGKKKIYWDEDMAVNDW
jgi:calcineurin-like phosphoesterase family protein